MADLRFACNAVEQFIAWELPAWVEQRHPGATGPVTVEVVHPDREMDGSCRWCGARRDELVTVREGRLVS